MLSPLVEKIVARLRTQGSRLREELSDPNRATVSSKLVLEP